MENSSNREVKNWSKIPPKISKMKNIATEQGRLFNPKNSYIDANQEFIRCGNHPDILPLFERLVRSLTSLLPSLRHEEHPHLPK
jgi:hypothetical protein